MHTQTTLSQYLSEQQQAGNLNDPGLLAVIEDITRACKVISERVDRGALGGVLGTTDNQNVQGETQAKLDVLSNEILLAMNERSGLIAAMASEEMEGIHPCNKDQHKAAYLLLFDPLDGSSNIEVNNSIGTIFSVLPHPEPGRVPTEQDFLQPGTNQLAAGYVIYGPATILMLTLGQGVHCFTLSRSVGEFVLTRENIRLPETTSEYAINSSYQRFWEPAIQRYIEECLQGEDGPRGRNFNMRWVGAMVADSHRILWRGGVFLYPRDRRQPPKPGKLRLMYEANPMCLLFEQAGGAGTNDTRRILDIQPEKLHQRVGLIMGCKGEVDRIVRYYKEQ